MKVSVIVPVYNASDYLEECLNSIISQTYKDLEIILIDDGSTDDSGTICDRYKEQDGRIVVIHQDNKGVSNARNRGLEIASGQLITFVDSDDTIDPNMIITLYNDLTDNQASVVISSYSTLKDEYLKPVGNSGTIFVFSKDEAIINLISGKYFIGGLCTKLYKSDIIKTCRMDENLKINEDVLMNYHVFENSEKILFHDTCLYHYRANFYGATNSVDQIRGRADEFYVAKSIYESSKGKAYYEAAEKRYYVSMLNYYQSYIMSARKKDKKAIQLKQQLKNEKATRKLRTKPQRIRCFLFISFPRIASFVYRIHEKTRITSHAPLFD